MNPINTLREKLASQRLARAVEARLEKEGYPVEDITNLPTAIRVLATKFYKTSAVYKRIIEGLDSLRRIKE